MKEIAILPDSLNEFIIEAPSEEQESYGDDDNIYEPINVMVDNIVNNVYDAEKADEQIFKLLSEELNKKKKEKNMVEYILKPSSIYKQVNVNVMIDDVYNEQILKLLNEDLTKEIKTKFHLDYGFEIIYLNKKNN